MSVTTSTNKAMFTQAGTTTEFSLEVKCFSTAEVKVFTKINGVQTEVTTGITKTAISGDLDNGVTVTFDTAPAVGTDIILIREIDETQILELSEGGNLSAQALEDALDRGVMISQQIAECFDRSIQFPVSDEAGTTYDVGTIEARANKVLGFDSAGNVTQVALAPAGGFNSVDTNKGLGASIGQVFAKVDDTTVEFSGGNIAVKAGGIGATQLASTLDLTGKTVSLSGAGITNGTVTKAKIENVASMKVLGNVTGSAAAPSEVAVLDEDDMASDSATSLATQQSIKAYVDASSKDGFIPSSYAGEQSITFPNGIIFKGGIINHSSGDSVVVTFDSPFPNGVSWCIACAGDGPLVASNVQAKEFTTNSITIYNDGGTSAYTSRWFAVGY